MPMYNISQVHAEPPSSPIEIPAMIVVSYQTLKLNLRYPEKMPPFKGFYYQPPILRPTRSDLIHLGPHNVKDCMLRILPKFCPGMFYFYNFDMLYLVTQHLLSIMFSL